MSSKSKTYFSGLDALRFFAASFVVVQHIQDNQFTQGLPHLSEYAFLNKGVTAVTFFFTLSGFLITYLLLDESKKNGGISIGKFYVRRMLRIWPLYFLVVFIGLTFYWALLPALGMDTKTQYQLGEGLFYFIFMMPNFANQYFQVGGILIVLWSIGVEEQFYLIWAPLMKFFKKYVWLTLLCLYFISLSLHIVNYHGLLGVSTSVQGIISELQFHYMAAGGIFAYLAFFHRNALLRNMVFSHKGVQWVLLSIIIIYFVFIPNEWVHQYIKAGLLPFLFAWLIVNLSINPSKIFSLNIPVLNGLGQISYGIYMYHMIVIYLVSFLAIRVPLFQQNHVLFQTIYHLAVLAFTLIIAHLSYKYYEKAFLSKRAYFGTKKTAEEAESDRISINYNLKNYDTI